ncbi:hypothetical protein V2647_08395 [Tenacibaculum maritimum]|uniref:hypothetical protein n=1 Tax=Tenacibaculum maritimum TaxID=107401 RepID=UPI0038772201
MVIGAYLGGVQANGSYNPFEWKGNASTLLGVLGGAIIGGISGGVGAYAAAKLAPLITTAGGFLGGAVSGFIGGAVGGTILGGVIGGIRSVFHGKGFWTGKDLASKATAKTISSLKTESVHDVAPKNNLSNQKLDLKTPMGNNKPVTGEYKKITALDGKTQFKLKIEPLRIGRSVEASWGKHFNYRHAFNSGFENVSRFSQGTSVNMIKDYISQALKYGTPINGGFEYTFGNAIGTNMNGGAAFSIRVFVRDGWVRTASPF